MEISTSTPKRSFMRRILRMMLLLPLAVVLGLVVSAPAASAATTDVTLHGSGSDWVAGKFADGNATYLRGDNHLETSLHVVSPYLFVGARGTVTTTIYADTPWGPYPLWQVAHGLTACSTTDPTCSSQPSQSWDDYPSYWDQQRIQQNASRMEVTVTVY
jgi:hypothetical protein